MKSCFGYVRVSTVKQGEGVSLEAQRDAILAFADRNNITITKWFEEKETAAKSGRPIFLSLFKQLMARKADGVVLHKVDRGARNLADWAKFAELADAGVDVHFATEALDFRSRGGRLTADIQAVIAADYIRNLREETIKGITGRLKQGIYPFKAPLGYLNNGGGKVKTIDPIKGPLVRRLFQLYATGDYPLRKLQTEAHAIGLNNSSGGRISKSGIETMLSNPFYCGLLHISTTGMTYQGVHEPLIGSDLFETVQTMRHNKGWKKVTKHQHLYRGLFTCSHCKKTMIGEWQKGHVYYRCHTSGCATKTIREERLESTMVNTLATFQLPEEALVTLRQNLTAYLWRSGEQALIQTMKLRKAKIAELFSRLTDAFVENLIDRDTYASKKRALEMENLRLDDELKIQQARKSDPETLHRFLELMKSLRLTYVFATDTEKRQIIQLTTSNRTVSEKNVALEPANWLQETEKSLSVLLSPHCRSDSRSSQELLELHISKLLECTRSKDAIALRQVIVTEISNPQ